MTGRDLIVYILQNNLENEEVFKDGVFLGCLAIDKVAIELHVGFSTVYTWVQLGYLDGIKINDILYILPNHKYIALKLKADEKEAKTDE